MTIKHVLVDHIGLSTKEVGPNQRMWVPALEPPDEGTRAFRAPFGGDVRVVTAAASSSKQWFRRR